MIEYDDFSLKIEPKRGDEYPVLVIQSPAGQGRSSFLPPFDPNDAEDLMAELGKVVRGIAGENKTRAIREQQVARPSEHVVGEQLFDALFQGPVRSLLDLSLGMMHGRDNRGLRIKLHVDPEDATLASLANLPWELLYKKETRDYLNLSKYTPVVRYLDVQRPFDKLALKLPLRILVVISNPTGTAGLDLHKERELIKSTWAQQDGVLVDFIESATVQNLQTALSSKEYHVLHYMGHGSFDASSGQGVLLMEDRNNNPANVSGTTLGMLLHDVRSLRFVFLNACNTARGTREKGLDPFAGVASAMVMAGLPAVVAMQFPISDQAAITFSGRFYPLLAEGFPVDAAVAEGRRAIALAQPNSLEWGTPVLFMRSPDGQIFDVDSTVAVSRGVVPVDVVTDEPPVVEDADQATVFISYKRDVEPDESLALTIRNGLQDSANVFIDQDIKVGAKWESAIEGAMNEADYLVILLSEHSVRSEMVLGEIELARRVGLNRNGRPKILPIRVGYREPFTYPLSTYLNAINWGLWDSDGDTSELIEDLRQAVLGGELSVNDESKSAIVESAQQQEIPAPHTSAQPSAHLETPEGTMNPESAFYLERPFDHVIHEAIQRKGVTITIKGPRQMGKSSLLMRTMAEAVEIGKRVIYLDFQLFADSALADEDLFFRQFCAVLSDELDIDDKVEEVWRRPLGNTHRCTRYVGKYVLKEIQEPLLLAMDEVERVFDAAFRSDFFSMLRSWHNERAISPTWRRLDMALVTSTEPYQLIENLNQSPFNVGEIVEMADFTLDEVGELNLRHGSPLAASELTALFGLLNGHPYLTRKALYLLAKGRMTFAELFRRSLDEKGPFSDHLRYHLFRLHGHDELKDCLRSAIVDGSCTDDSIFWRLRGAGLVRKELGKVVARNKLYADYFRGQLDG